MIPAIEPGSYFYRSEKMPVTPFVHGQIAGVVQRPRKLFDPLVHLLLVEVGDAQPLGAAPQLAGVLGGDNDAVRHHPDFYRHPVGKSCLRDPYLQYL